jgi:hypothetical protein
MVELGKVPSKKFPLNSTIYWISNIASPHKKTLWKLEIAPSTTPVREHYWLSAT